MKLIVNSVQKGGDDRFDVNSFYECKTGLYSHWLCEICKHPVECARTDYKYVQGLRLSNESWKLAYCCAGWRLGVSTY